MTSAVTEARAICPDCGADAGDAATCPDCGCDMSGQGRSVPSLPDVERRTVTLETADFRDLPDGNGYRFSGHAAVFDSWSQDLGGFRERIQRGAFRKVLRSNPDVVLLFNHDANIPLARSTVADGPGSLRMSEDGRGLYVEAELVPTQAASDLRQLMSAGVVSQMSFGFSMRGGRDEWRDGPDGMQERTITEFGSLFDVSPVVYPAYTATDAAMRARVAGFDLYDDDGCVQEDILQAVASRIQRGTLAATDEERGRVDSAYAKLGRLSPWMEELARRSFGIEAAGTASTDAEDDTAKAAEVGQWRLAARKRRHRIRQLTDR